MKPVFVIEVKSSDLYFMTYIKGQNFRYNGFVLLRSSIIRWKYHPFIVVIKYSSSVIISIMELMCAVHAKNERRKIEKGKSWGRMNIR